MRSAAQNKASANYLANHADRRAKTVKKYNSSDKGKANAHSRYLTLDKEQEKKRQQAYIQSPAGQLSQRRARLAKYNITLEQYDALLARQGGVCGICQRPETNKRLKYLSVDHDHSCCPLSKVSCGKCVRGLLCTGCNRRLGAIETNSWMSKALIYLERGWN